MESLNLNMLASSLPPSNLANAEKELTNNFKAAALSLTTFYRTSRRTSKRAYNAGYAAACQDMLLMIQQGVSTGESSDTAGQGMTIGRIMDYIEARLEAIKSREEEEDEDEEKEKDREKERARPAASASVGSKIASKLPSASTGAPPTPQTPSLTTMPPPAMPSSPSPSPAPPIPLQRTSKTRLFALSNPKEVSVFNAIPTNSRLFDTPDVPVAIIPAQNAPPSPAAIMPETVGMKRRHNVMMLDSATPAPSVAADAAVGTSRRRTRSTRGAALGAAPTHQVQDQNRNVVSSDDMDVEEEGRERKRVARR
ncbi:predicted protein [Sparassis crispa]|uniref:Uncharacterized protein n=1 Tax=Sparassis crispa TaxID=139825 RepID=A0A401GYP2_9APHY|nr:predicted protein [Sparassis crispa]GBE87283.1 predicted protein [Sparassis crispa]